MRIWVPKSASMQKRTSRLKFGELAENSGFNSVSNLSTKAASAAAGPGVAEEALFEGRRERGGKNHRRPEHRGRRRTRARTRTFPLTALRKS